MKLSSGRRAKRRWRGAAAAVPLLLAAAAGCSSAASTTSSTSTTSFTYAYYGNAVELQVYKQAVSLYESTHPGVHISTTYNAPAQFLAQLPVQLRSGGQPDVVNVADSWVSLLQSTFDDFVDLTPYIKRANISEKSFVPGTWTPGALNNQQLMLPNVVYGDAVAINETLFKKYHVPLPSANWTSAQLLSDAMKLTQGSGSSKIWGIAAPLGTGETSQLFGGQLFNVKTNQMTATSPATSRAIAWVVDLVTKDKVTPAQSISYSGSSTLIDPFLTGNAAMDITYASYDQASDSQEIGSKFQWTVVPFPSDMDGSMQLNATSILKGPNNPPSKYQAEFNFINWLSTNSAALKLQGQLSSPAYEPALSQWLAHPSADWANVNRPATIAALSRSPYGYDGRAYTEVWTMLGNELTSMISGQTSIPAGISDIQSQGNADLSSLGSGG